MTDPAPQKPQIYLATPRRIELMDFPDLLARALDKVPVACLRLSLDTHDEDELSRAADLLREVAHARDIPLVVDNHYRIVERLGLDGVHMTDGARRVRDVRKALPKDAILGAFCGTSRHDGMTAGELGADYVSFGPVRASSLLGDGSEVDPEVFRWWSEMIEIPVVAEGGLDTGVARDLAPFADFLCLGDEVWSSDDPMARLSAFHDAIA